MSTSVLIPPAIGRRRQGEAKQRRHMINPFGTQARTGSSSSLQVVSVTNAACNSYSNVTHLVTYWPPWTVEEGDTASYFVSGPTRTGPSGENVSPPSTGLQKGQQWPGVSVGLLFFVVIFFSERADSRYSQGMPVKKITQYSKVWLRRANSKPRLTPKFYSMLKLINYSVLRNYANYTCFPHKSPNAQRLFLEIDPDCSHTCSKSPG